MFDTLIFLFLLSFSSFPLLFHFCYYFFLSFSPAFFFLILSSRSSLFFRLCLSLSSFCFSDFIIFFFLFFIHHCYVHCPWLSLCVFVWPSLFISVSVFIFVSVSVSSYGFVVVAISVLRCSDVAVRPPLSIVVLPSCGVVAVSRGPVQPFSGLASLSGYLYSLLPSVV